MKTTCLQTAWVLTLSAVLFACKKSGVSNPPPVIISPPPDFGFKVVGCFPSYRDHAAITANKYLF